MNDSKLRSALGYKRFSDRPKILIFDSKYHVVGDIQDAAWQLGWEMPSLTTPQKGRGSKEFVVSLLTSLVQHRPDFVLTINHFGFDENGVLAALLARYNIPVASWFVDHPIPILGSADNNATDNLQIFCFERSTFKWFSNTGYKTPTFLPTGANPVYFSPLRIKSHLASMLSCRISFVGNSWWHKARVDPPDHILKAARIISSEHTLNRKNIGKFFESLHQQNKDIFAAVKVVLAEASMQTRAEFVRQMSPLSLQLFGDPQWKYLCPDIKVQPPLSYKEELPALFSATALNLNVTAEQIPTGVNQRVWNVPASKGALLTDAQEDALDIFKDGESMIFYDSLEEAYSKAEYYLSHRKKLSDIAVKGQSIVEQNHLMTHRLLSMYAQMKKIFT